jgi:uncharacterized membrane protein
VIDASFDPRVGPSAEHRLLAAVLEIGTRLSLLVLLAGFAAYVTGLAEPLVAIETLPRYWGLRASEYLREAAVPSGWGWLRFVAYGDCLNFVGIAMLAGLTIVSYLVLLPAFWRKRDVTYSLIALLEVVILALAASGLVAVRH